jgi:alpha-ketoglutarate-dependent taurine dioxygenase
MGSNAEQSADSRGHVGSVFRVENCVKQEEVHDRTGKLHCEEFWLWDVTFRSNVLSIIRVKRIGELRTLA